MTTFTYKIELSDLKRAAWLHMKPRKAFAVAGMLLLILAIMVLAIAAYRLTTSGKDLKVVLTLGGVLTYFGMWFFVILPRSLARVYQQQKLLHQELSVQISETHFAAKSFSAECNLPWDLFHKWKSNKTLILLYQSDALYHIFPCRAFSSTEDFKAFRNFLKTKLGPPHV